MPKVKNNGPFRKAPAPEALGLAQSRRSYIICKYDISEWTPRDLADEMHLPIGAVIHVLEGAGYDLSSVEDDGRDQVHPSYRPTCGVVNASGKFCMSRGHGPKGLCQRHGGGERPKNGPVVSRNLAQLTDEEHNLNRQLRSEAVGVEMERRHGQRSPHLFNGEARARTRPNYRRMPCPQSSN